MSFLPFFRMGVVAANASNAVTLFTQPLITSKYVEVVAVLRADIRMMGTLGATFTASPQISNDLAGWDDVTPAFSAISPGSTYPVVEVKKITKLGRFMRFKLVLFDGAGGNTGITFSLLGDGKVDHEEPESREDFLASVFAPRMGSAGLVPLPASPFLPPVSTSIIPVPPSGVPPAGGPSPSASSAGAGPAPVAGAPSPPRPTGANMYMIYWGGRPTGLVSGQPVELPMWAISSRRPAPGESL